MYSYIKKENGIVYLVQELDAEGKHCTVQYLGLDPDNPQKEDKPKKKTKKEDAE